MLLPPTHQFRASAQHTTKAHLSFTYNGLDIALCCLNSEARAGACLRLCATVPDDVPAGAGACAGHFCRDFWTRCDQKQMLCTTGHI